MSLAMPEFIQLVRKFICDFPKANELRGVAESTDPEIALYAMLALDDYNSTPPLIAPVAFEGHPSTGMLMLGTLCHLFMSKGILQLRNSLSYSDGGVSVNVWDKGPAYAGNAQMFGQMWESKKIALKRSINLSAGWGVVQSSEFNLYNYTSYFGGDYIPGVTGLVSPGSLYPGGVLGGQGTMKRATGVVPITIPDWHPVTANPNRFEFVFVHNLNYQNVELIVMNEQGHDISNGVGIDYASVNHLFIYVNRLDNIFAGSIQAFVK